MLVMRDTPFFTDKDRIYKTHSDYNATIAVMVCDRSDDD